MLPHEYNIWEKSISERWVHRLLFALGSPAAHCAAFSGCTFRLFPITVRVSFKAALGRELRSRDCPPRVSFKAAFGRESRSRVGRV